MDAGAEVIGVSPDSQNSHLQFAKKRNLPFRLLVDERSALKRRWVAKKMLGLLPGRATFVIDKQGVIRHIYSSALQPKKHAKVALKIVQRLS